VLCHIQSQQRMLQQIQHIHTNHDTTIGKSSLSLSSLSSLSSTHFIGSNTSNANALRHTNTLIGQTTNDTNNTNGISVIRQRLQSIVAVARGEEDDTRFEKIVSWINTSIIK
jgi:hypothetical protein